MDDDFGGEAGFLLSPPPVFPDPLGEAVKKLFGLSYLFPYQRLVTANILEAAAGAGIPVRWPEDTDGAAPENTGGGEPDAAETERAESPETGPVIHGGAEPGAGEAAGVFPEGAALGRQIVILPTGAGKSLCFQLPAMLLEGPTLVIYPILSLMADQERRLRERGFEPALLRGGQDEAERNRIWEQLAAGKSRFIIANPEVLLTERMLGKLKTLGILHIVIDEAHCVSEWGESFRPAYLRLREIIDAAGSPLVTAFTATASAPVLEKIERYVFGAPARRIIGNPDRSNIRYAAQGCLLRDLAVRDLLSARSLPAIVFCSSRPGTEKLSRYLGNEFKEAGRPEAADIRFYHAGLSREEKTAVEQWFFGNPRGILVSTCAYGMGVDKADIRTVIHRDCPPSVEAYLQESGRAGRDGKPSEAILLWGPGDGRRLEQARSSAEGRRMARLLDYAHDTRRCRREALLRLLNYEGAGDSPEKNCCDVCEGPGETAAVLREEPALLDFFRRNRRAYTVEEAAQVLSEAEHIRWSAEEAKQAVKELIKLRKLRVSGNPLWKRRITAGREKAADSNFPLKLFQNRAPGYAGTV
ncbi:MAG: RecQ family ATP-dependent DNA helicase [Treponema sp.]|jgi:ATP-dependent DNA helicase RecQ|nr:RecQ family ATP-dependent DNA helicase [Treponema sp.]